MCQADSWLVPQRKPENSVTLIALNKTDNNR